MPLTLPYTISPADDILAEPLQANFQSIVDKFSGGIVNADCSTLMAFDGAKVAINTLPGDRIATGTVTQTQMGNNSVGGPQIVALAVDKTKLSTTVGTNITLAQVNLSITAMASQVITPLGTVASASPIFDMRYSPSGGQIGILVTGYCRPNSGTLEVATLQVTAVALPTGTYQYLGSYISDLVDNGAGFTFTLNIIAIAKS